MLQTKINFIKSKKSKRIDFVQTRESTSEIRRDKETLANKSKLKRIIDELSTESEGSDIDNLIERLNDVSEKTTYKSNSNETVCVGSDDVISISSDETSKETAPEKSKLKKKKTKRKKHSRKKTEIPLA